MLIIANFIGYLLWASTAESSLCALFHLILTTVRELKLLWLFACTKWGSDGLNNLSMITELESGRVGFCVVPRTPATWLFYLWSSTSLQGTAVGPPGWGSEPPTLSPTRVSSPWRPTPLYPGPSSSSSIPSAHLVLLRFFAFAPALCYFPFCAKSTLSSISSLRECHFFYESSLSFPCQPLATLTRFPEHQVPILAQGSTNYGLRANTELLSDFVCSTS